MKEPFYLPSDIAEDEVTKVEFPTNAGDNINSQGLHFVPPSEKPNHEAIGSHSHDNDSERYYILKINKDEKGEIKDFEWIPLDAVSASTPDCNTHSVMSANEIQIIFGVKRSQYFNNKNWPEDILPTVDYNTDYDLFRFKLGENAVYTHSDFKQIFIEKDSKIYIAPNSRYSDKEEMEQPGINNYVVSNTVSKIDADYLSSQCDYTSR